MKVLLLSGAARKNGNIANMLKIAEDIRKEKGDEVTYINLYDSNIKYCTSCMKCRSTQRCVMQDDMTKITDLFVHSDLVILAAPTYYANVPACVKAMFDRLAGVLLDDSKTGYPGKRLQKEISYILMTTCTTPSPFDKIAGQSTGSIKAMKEVFHSAGMKYKGKIVFAGTSKKTKIPDRIVHKIEKVVKNA